MELQITGTNMELTTRVKEYAEKKLRKLSRHLPTIIETKVEISEEKTRAPEQHYLVRVTVDSGVGGAVFHGEERGEDLMQAIDKVAAVMMRQVERHKGRIYDKGRGNSLARGAFSEEAGESKKIVKTKHFALESISVDDAIEQMEDLGHSFYLFTDARDGAIKLVYKRNEGDYGLIVPEVA